MSVEFWIKIITYIYMYIIKNIYTSIRECGQQFNIHTCFMYINLYIYINIYIQMKLVWIINFCPHSRLHIYIYTYICNHLFVDMLSRRIGNRNFPDTVMSRALKRLNTNGTLGSHLQKNNWPGDISKWSTFCCSGNVLSVHCYILFVSKVQTVR